MSRSSLSDRVRSVLGDFWGRSRPSSACEDEFAPLFIDRLEDRRVLSVTASLSGGVLSIIGDDGVNDAVEVTLTNAGEDGGGSEEGLQIFDQNGNVIPISTDSGLTFDPLPTSSLYDPVTMSPGRIHVDLGVGEDQLELQIPTGASFEMSSSEALAVEVSGGDDLVTLVDNGIAPPARNVDVTIDASEVEFADVSFQAGTVNLTIEADLILRHDQSIATDGIVSVTGDVLSVGGKHFDLSIDTGQNDVVIDGNLGSPIGPLGDVTISASEIRLSGDAFTYGDQLYDGDLSLTNDTILESTAGGDIEIGNLSANGSILNVNTSGLTHFSGDVDGLNSLVIDNLGQTQISGNSFDVLESVVFGDQVTLKSDVIISAVEQIRFESNVVSESLMFSTLELVSAGDGSTGSGRVEILGSAGQAGGAELGGLEVVAGSMIALNDVRTFAAGGQSGDQRYETNSLITEGQFSTRGGDWTVTGDWDVRSSVIVQTFGGAIDISGATVSTSTTSTPVDVRFDPQSVAGGNVSLGEFDDHFGSFIRNLEIFSASDVTVNSLSIDGAFTQQNGMGRTEFVAGAVVSTNGLLSIGTDSILVGQSAVIESSGASIVTTDEMLMLDGSVLDAGSESVSIVVNRNEIGAESFEQFGSAMITTGSESSTAIEIDVQGEGFAKISDLRAGMTGGVVSVETGGEIVDVSTGDSQAAVSAFGAVFMVGESPNVVSAGVGTIVPFETNVSQLAFHVPKGVVNIENQGSLMLSALNSVSQSTATEGGRITSGGALTIDTNLEVGGDFELVAGDSSSMGDTLTINADIQHLTGNGFILFQAGDDIIQNDGQVTNRGGAVNEVRFVANVDGAADLQVGQMTQNGGTVDAERVSFSSGGPISFLQNLNDFGTVAAVTTRANSGIYLFDQGGMTFGTVNGISGLTTNDGDVSFASSGQVVIGSGAGEGIHAVGGIVRGYSTGGVVEAIDSVIIAEELKLQGEGPVQLQNDNDLSVIMINVDGPIVFNDVNGFTIGSLETVEGVSTVDDDIELRSGGLITIGQGNGEMVSAVGATVRIFADAGVVEASGSSIAASDLQLQGTGTFDLGELNSVERLAAEITDDLLFRNVGDLEIGTVGSLTGIRSSVGEIFIETSADLIMPSTSFVETGGDRVLLAGGDATQSPGASLGEVFMEDGSEVRALNARIDLAGSGEVQVGRIVSNGDVRLTSLFGEIRDAGDAGGVDIEASRLGLDAAIGIGNLNAIQTSVAELSARNSTSGNVQISNVGQDLLTIGTFGDPMFDAEWGLLTGITLGGISSREILVTNEGAMNVDAVVMNTSGGDITLKALSRADADLRVAAPIIAIGGSSADVFLETDGSLSIEDTGEMFDILGSSITGEAVGDVTFAADVIVKSGTGSITNPVPLLENVSTPQVLTSGIAKILGDFGRVNDNTFVFEILWDPDGPVEDVYTSGDPVYSAQRQEFVGPAPGIGPGEFLFDHQYLENPNEESPSSPIPIQITLYDDPNILFTSGGEELGKVSVTSLAPVPGEGLFGSIPFDLSIEVPQPEPPRTEITESRDSDVEVVAESQEELEFETVTDIDTVQNERIVVIQKIDSQGDVEVDRFGRPIQRSLYGKDAEAVLSNLPGLFEKLRDGHWKIFMKEGQDAQLQLVEDVELRDGRPASSNDAGTMDRPPTSEGDQKTEGDALDNSSTSLEPSDSGALRQALQPEANVRDQSLSEDQRSDREVREVSSSGLGGVGAAAAVLVATQSGATTHWSGLRKFVRRVVNTFRSV
ncbi:hypothetical protein KOR42_19800 [Thalassoglobus neptunius]|uniref:Uncharacterized protein n=1 Tax=Thalassoglobus neptunius TaxID=1938619 RepID=A0A5C5X760_9PLAN|nr:hypothetical protein [Thalassoglobus neptunius]TWT58598.1 hypothetical protein KOR42_19800 [Thalassoglobus neptunius]